MWRSDAKMPQAYSLGRRERAPPPMIPATARRDAVLVFVLESAEVCVTFATSRLKVKHQVLHVQAQLPKRFLD